MLTKLNTDLNVVQKLDDQPNAVTGLTASQVKAKFDEAANAIKTFVNNTLTAEQDAINTNLQNQINSNATDISALGTRITTNEGNITSIQANKADKTEVLTKTNTTSFTPTSNFHPSTKKYVDDSVAGVVLGQIPDNSLTETKMANDMKKDIVGGVASYDNFVSQMAEKATKTEVNESISILTPSGTANAITLPVTLVNGKKYSFKATTNSTGAVTINGVDLKKTDGTAVSNLKANKVYDFYYDQAQNSVFILAKAEGDALVGDVLAGKVFSNGDDTGLVGALALAGTATVGDVASGKTFYNTDAKTKLIGTNTNKKWASGTANGVYSSGVGTFLNVSGLSFRPSQIIVWSNAYSGLNWLLNLNTIDGSVRETVIASYDNTKILVYPTQVSTISSNGFSKVLSGDNAIHGVNIQFYWIAIE